MSTAYLRPYLMFKDGQAAEVLEFYRSVFGGELHIMKFGDMPGAREDNKDLVMHGALDNDTLTIFASDGMPDTQNVAGNNVQLSVNGPDEARLTGYFNGLAEGGKVIEPLNKAPWGDTYGSLTDKYGINWMFNIGDVESNK